MLDANLAKLYQVEVEYLKENYNEEEQIKSKGTRAMNPNMEIFTKDKLHQMHKQKEVR